MAGTDFGADILANVSLLFFFIGLYILMIVSQTGTSWGFHVGCRRESFVCHWYISLILDFLCDISIVEKVGEEYEVGEVDHHAENDILLRLHNEKR